MRLLTTTLACLLALAAPAMALDWGHSTDEALGLRVREAGLHMTDPAFQRWMLGINQANYGKLVRRAGWVVDAYAHVSIPGQVTVNVSNRVDRGGISWTLYLPGTIGHKLQPGDQIEWEGTITKVLPSGDVTLVNERLVRRVGQGPVTPDAPRFWNGGRGVGEAPWWFQTLAERPVVRRVEPVLPYLAYTEGVPANPVVRVWVSPPGHVAKADIVSSSGRLDVDLAVLDAVKQWRFQPFPPGRSEDQLGEFPILVRATP